MKGILIGTGLLCGIAALVYFGKKQIDLLQNAKIRIRKINKISANGGSTVINYDLEIVNESGVVITLNNLTIDIYSNGITIGKLNYGKEIKIQANGSTLVPLSTSINSKALLNVLASSLIDLISAKSIDLTFKIQVDAKVLGVSIKEIIFEDTIKQFKL